MVSLLNIIRNKGILMAKLNTESLDKYRKESVINLEKEIKDNIVILIGMGTCGIAAGSEDTKQSLEMEFKKLGINNVIIKPAGCMGACYFEPIIEIFVPDMPTVLYGRVDGDIARKIVNEHVVNKRLVGDHIIDKPAVDIYKLK